VARSSNLVAVSTWLDFWVRVSSGRPGSRGGRITDHATLMRKGRPIVTILGVPCPSGTPSRGYLMITWKIGKEPS
jgi:hypothetical protein